MFKPGEVAVVKGSGRKVTVQACPVATPGHKWPVVTSEGTFEETDLAPAHPTVLATASGRDLARDAFRADMDFRRARAGEGLPPELRDEVEEVLKEAKLDLSGHWKDGEAIDGFKILEHLFIGPNAMSKADAEDVVRAAKAKTIMDRWAPVGLHLSVRTCSFCGEDGFKLETNGLVVRVVGDRCKYADGLPPTEWELNVPSGRLAVANDLRGVFPLPEDDDFDVNTALGCAQTALAYAANGMSHAFVGNSCPGVYRCGDGTYKIANPPRDDVWNGKKYVPVDPVPEFDGERVAGICTDLRWYSVADDDEFARRCEHFKRERGDFGVDVVDVRPGVYRFRHDEEAREHDGPGECVYARFEWVREPDPVVDHVGAYESVDVNPHAYVQAMVKRWPTLYGKRSERFGGEDTVVPWSDMTEEDRRASWASVADHVFCTIGGGVEWHEKGFPRAKVDGAVPDVDPPSFREQRHWYPFSKPYGGLFEPKTLTPSFAKVAFRILESVISFGMDVHDGDHSREVRYVRQRMLLAVKRCRELVKLYPEQADPEYVAWLGQEGRAEAWVASFDLGPEYMERHEEHARRQRWVPEGTYAVAFDARKLKDGHFAWHPKEPGVGGCWASKENAQRYALNAWEDNGQEDAKANCSWTCHARNASVPLFSVARVVKIGEVSHMGETLVEIQYDYGTPWMQDAGKRKALVETSEKLGIRVLTKEQYEELLPKAIKFFEDGDAAVGKKSKGKKPKAKVTKGAKLQGKKLKATRGAKSHSKKGKKPKAKVTKGAKPKAKVTKGAKSQGK